MASELATTNLLLAILAAVSVLEALLIISAGIGSFLAYRRVVSVIHALESRRIAPAMARVHAILDDVKGITTTVNEGTERVDHAIRTTMNRVDDTANRLTSNVRGKTNRLIGFLRGVRVAVDSILEKRLPATTENQEPYTRTRNHIREAVHGRRIGSL